MRWLAWVPVVALLLFCSGAERATAQTAHVAFKGRVKAVEGNSIGSIITKTISVSIDALDGSGRSVSLLLKNETEARLFGYGDEVTVDITPTGRKAE